MKYFFDGENIFRATRARCDANRVTQSLLNRISLHSLRRFKASLSENIITRMRVRTSVSSSLSCKLEEAD